MDGERWVRRRYRSTGAVDPGPRALPFGTGARSPGLMAVGAHGCRLGHGAMRHPHPHWQ